MIGTLLFWFIWLVGFVVVGSAVSASAYIAIDKERREKAQRIYQISRALQTQVMRGGGAGGAAGGAGEAGDENEHEPTPAAAVTMHMSPPPPPPSNKKED